MTSQSEFTTSWRPNDFQFDEAILVPEGSESSSMVSAESEAVDSRSSTNSIVATAKAAVKAASRVVVPAAKVMALSTAKMAEGASDWPDPTSKDDVSSFRAFANLEMSFITPASLERMLALILSLGVLAGLCYYEFVISRPVRREKAIKEAERLLQFSRVSTSLKLSSSKVNKSKRVSCTPSSESARPVYDYRHLNTITAENVRHRKTTSQSPDLPRQTQKKVPFEMDPEWQPPLASGTNKCQVPCQECTERAKRDAQAGRATPQSIPTCGLDHSGCCPQSTELLWHPCPLCCSYLDMTGTSSFTCLLYTSPSPRDKRQSRMACSA